MAQIASASQEQSQGIGEVNTAVSRMDKVTQSTASSAEESAAAAEELNAQAKLLKSAINELQTAGFEQGPAPERPSGGVPPEGQKISTVRSQAPQPSSQPGARTILISPCPNPSGREGHGAFKDFDRARCCHQAAGKWRSSLRAPPPMIR